MWVVHWKINGISGHGRPVNGRVSMAAVEQGNKDYGPGSHWRVEVIKGGES